MIGIDIVGIERIKKMHEKFGDKFYNRFLNEEEKDIVKKQKQQQDFGLQKRQRAKQ